MLPPRPMPPWHSHSTDSSVRHTSYAPVMIEMSLERGVLTPTTDKDGKPTTEIRNFTTSFNLPLLTIIPVNSLGVNNVDISFEMEVKSSFSETESIGVNTIIEAFTQLSSRLRCRQKRVMKRYEVIGNLIIINLWLTSISTGVSAMCRKSFMC